MRAEVSFRIERNGLLGVFYSLWQSISLKQRNANRIMQIGIFRDTTSMLLVDSAQIPKYRPSSRQLQTTT